MKQINTVAVELIKKSKSVIEAAKDIKDGFSFNKLMVLSKEVCIVVETYTQEVGTLSSQVKLSLAIELLVNLVDIPFVPQRIEKIIYNIALDKALDYLNSTFGKDWLDFNKKTKPVNVVANQPVNKTVNVVVNKAEDKVASKKVTKIGDVRANLRKRTGI